MNKLISILLALLISSPVLAGLQASFTSSRHSGLTRESTVTEYWGDVTGANVFVDHSGENNMTYTEDFSNAAWTKSNVTVTADQVRGPEGSSADLLTPSAADSYLYQDDAGSAAGETHTCAFDLRSVIGNVNLSIHVYSETHTAIRGTETITVTPYWRRYSVQGVLIAGDTDIGCTIGGNTTWSTGENIYAVRASSQENDEWRTNLGIYHPVLAATTKPDHDLAPTNAPTAGRSHLQAAGNKGPAREFNGVNQDYRKADHASLDVWDGDHTITILHLASADDSGVIFSHGAFNIDGVYIQRDQANDRMDAVYSSGGSAVTVQGSAGASTVGYYHILQVVRSGNTVNVCMDGVCGANYDVTGEGVNPARSLYMGNYNGAGSFWDGQIAYFRVDTDALSVDERAVDREALLGIATNWSSVNAWSFSRSTTAYKTFSNKYENMYPMHSMDLVAANHPRVSGQGGGVLIEGQVTQLHGLTEAFNSWTQGGICVVTANDYIAPNGTLTADELDNTGGANLDRRFLVTANLGDLTGRDFTFSVWVRADTPHDIEILFSEVGVAFISNVVFYATNEWQRFVIGGTAVGGGAGTIRAEVFPGDRGVSTGVAHFWGANLTETTFATSYVPNPGVATSQVTKTADDMGMEVHPAGTNEIVLADEFCATCAANKLTIYGEWKAEWSSVTDIGGVARRLVSIGEAGSLIDTVDMIVNSDGRVIIFLYDNGGTTRWIRSAVHTSYDEWFTVQAVIDFADLSRSELWVDEVVDHNSDSNMTGTAIFDTTDCLIRIGSNRTGTVDGFNWTKSLRVNNQEIRP